jgi:glycerate 2-kinase
MRRLLEELYAAAVAAAMPGPALAARLERVGLRPGEAPWIIALGKAALPMARAATAELRRRGLEPAGGLVVAPAEAPSPHPALECRAGDHPEPGPRSHAAARALEAVVRRVGPRDEVWLLLSGGTTSLVGAPVAGITPDELAAVYRLLLGSGLEIGAMNVVRKRFARWGAGRLAAALAPAAVRGFVVSDVIGDDLTAIASGPCSPDPAAAGEVRQLLVAANLWDRIPASARNLVLATDRGEVPETPKAGHEAFARVVLELIASNRLAVDAAATRAAKLGLAPVTMETPLAGEAAAAGASVAARLLQHCAETGFPQPSADRPKSCVIWGGETTVILGEQPPGLGGRCQELALAAARALAGAPAPVALLAAGTDGRDGPTDAAGAVVDGSTWMAITAAGRDSERDLADHDAYHALDAVGALLRAGHTGTNVMDVVIGIC